MLEKTDEAREAVLALKPLFTEAGFLPRARNKLLAQSPLLPLTSPIYHYLLFALGVKPADDKIIQYLARWLCYYTERIDEEFAARPFAENVLYVAHKARRLPSEGKSLLLWGSRFATINTGDCSSWPIVLMTLTRRCRECIYCTKPHYHYASPASIISVRR